MKTTIYSIALVFLSYSCSLIFEDDITKEYVELISPADSINTHIYTHNFSWEEMDGAVEYRLLIASPSFETIENLVVDTTTQATTFSKTFDFAGTYQWKVIAQNSAYTSDFQVRTFIIDASIDLTDQNINLLYPISFFYTNKDSQIFTWEKLPSAKYYNFLLRETDSLGNYLLLKDSLRQNSFEISFNELSLNDGIYYWKLFAYNDLPSLSNSRYNSFQIDKTAPNAPVLDVLDTIKKSDVTLTWKNVTDNGSPVFDSIFIFSDSQLLFNSRKDTSNTQKFDDLSTHKTYIWKVKSYDYAGNESTMSIDTFYTQF